MCARRKMDPSPSGPSPQGHQAGAWGAEVDCSLISVLELSIELRQARRGVCGCGGPQLPLASGGILRDRRAPRAQKREAVEAALVVPGLRRHASVHPRRCGAGRTRLVGAGRCRYVKKNSGAYPARQDGPQGCPGAPCERFGSCPRVLPVRGELAPSRGPSRPRFDEGVPSEAAGIPRLEDPA